MRRSLALPLALCAGLLAGCTLTGTAHAQQPDLTESYTWHDGEREHTVWLHPGFLAEFSTRPAADSPVRDVAPQASVASEHGAIRVWRVEGTAAREALRGVRSDGPAEGRYSPVFFNNPRGAGEMRALPGGVIVTLDPTWEEARARRWLENRGHTVERRLRSRANTFLVATAPGLDALRLANALSEADGVLAAFPNWWRPMQLR